MQRIDAMEVFLSLHKSTVSCLESICDDGPRKWSSDSVTDARGLLLAITTTDFLSALVITNSCLKYLKALTSNLQAESKDILSAVEEVNNVIDTLQDVRDNVSTYHSTWFNTVDSMCQEVGVLPSLPRRCSRQTQRNNVPADTPSEYYCRSLSIPLLDHLLSEMKSRFSHHQQTALLGLCIIPAIMVTLPTEECSGRINHFTQMYHNDMPSPDSITSEFHCWQMKWQQEELQHGRASLPSSPAATLRHTSSMYPNIRALVCILCTLPVTTCSAERSFSGLKRIKTAFRSSMTTQRLTGLALLNVHRDIPIDIPAAIDNFARRYPRRLQMINILEDN